MQEALANVTHHSGARTARVTVERSDDALRVSVEDDGRGPDEEILDPRCAARLTEAGHHGLQIMRERAGRAGGWLQISALPTGGTRVTLTVEANTPQAAAQSTRRRSSWYWSTITRWSGRGSRISVYTVKKDMTGLDPFYYSGPSFRKAVLDTVYYDNGAPGTIASTGESIFLQDAALYEGFLQYPEEHRKPGSYLGIALKNESRVVGVMGFSHSEPHAFRVDDLDAIRTLSPLISAGFEKAELFRKTLELSRVDELTGLLNYRVLME